jgi:transaldolase
MKTVEHLKVQIFADGADKDSMIRLYQLPFIKGFTTNPTLMRKAGVTDYKTFAREVLSAIRDRPISFEVFADEFDEMERQAKEISGWGDNVYVKIPITNTRRESSLPLLERLAQSGLRLNVTAVMPQEQIASAARSLEGSPSSYISVFAGRIADTGRDPIPLMAEAVGMLKSSPHIQLIWASPRELLNIFQADAIGCDVITVTSDILRKLDLVGKELDDYSLDTVQMFFDDGRKAAYTL